MSEFRINLDNNLTTGLCGIDFGVYNDTYDFRLSGFSDPFYRHTRFYKEPGTKMIGVEEIEFDLSL